MINIEEGQYENKNIKYYNLHVVDCYHNNDCSK